MWNTSQSLTTPQTWLPWQTRHQGQKYIWILIVNVNSIVPIYNTHNKYIHMSSKCIAMYTSIHISIVRTDYIMLWVSVVQCSVWNRLYIWTIWVTYLDTNDNSAWPEWGTRRIDILCHGMIRHKMICCAKLQCNKSQRVYNHHTPFSRRHFQMHFLE